MSSCFILYLKLTLLDFKLYKQETDLLEHLLSEDITPKREPQYSEQLRASM